MDNNFKRDLVDFLAGNEAPPKNLELKIQKDILFSMNRYSILSKFILFQILGAFVTLAFCPQFGIGLVEGHGFTHILRMIGDWACAAFCGSLFLSSGTLIAIFGMKGDELFWIWDRYKFPLVFLPAFFWSGLMLGNLSFKLPSETFSYSFIWILSAILTQQLFLKIKSIKYTGIFKANLR